MPKKTKEQMDAETRERLMRNAKRLMSAAAASNSGDVNAYISAKLAEARAAALEKSRTRTMPAVPVGGMEDNRNKAKALRYDADLMRSRLSWPAYKLGEYTPLDFNYSVDGPNEIRYVDPERLRIATLRRASELENEAGLYDAGKKRANGASCIYTATDNYGNKYRVASNRAFEANDESNGFLRIPMSDVEPGDIVQSKAPGLNGVPGHGMILDSIERDWGVNRGDPTFNYSNGGEDESAIVIGGHFTDKDTFRDDNWFNAFRFVGTPADSLRWKNEYEQMNQMGSGGSLRGFDDGGELNPGGYNTLVSNIPGGFVPANPPVNVTVPYSTEQPKEPRKPKNRWDRIINDRYNMAYDALLRSGEDKVRADRLARFLAPQSALETGWVDGVEDNNYAGYKFNNEKMKFDSTDSFWDYHLKNLDQKWPGWRNSKSLDDYFNLINHTDLGLTTKDKYNAYNRAHRGNEVYIYAPDWDNDNYWGKLRGVYNKYVNGYVAPLFDTGGMMEKYGADRIRAAINQMKCGGKMHRYDGLSEPSGYLYYNPDFDSDVELIEPAVVTAQAPRQINIAKDKQNAENDALAQAIIDRVNQDERARDIANGRVITDSPLVEEHPLAAAIIGGKGLKLASTTGRALYNAAKKALPKVGKFALTALRDLPAFELLDRLPTLAGGRRFTTLGGDAGQWVGEKVTGRDLTPLETSVWRLPGAIAAGVAPGVAADVATKGIISAANYGLDAIGRAIRPDISTAVNRNVIGNEGAKFVYTPSVAAKKAESDFIKNIESAKSAEDIFAYLRGLDKKTVLTAEESFALRNALKDKGISAGKNMFDYPEYPFFNPNSYIPSDYAVGRWAKRAADGSAGSNPMRAYMKDYYDSVVSARVKEPEVDVVDRIIERAKSGEIPPLNTSANDYFGTPIVLPERWAAAMRTPEYQRAYPNGADYFFRGSTDPVIYTNSYGTQYPSLFGGDFRMASGYNAVGPFHGGDPVVKSGEMVRNPNMHIYAVPKGTILDLGDFRGGNWGHLTSARDAQAEFNRLQDEINSLLTTPGADYSEIAKLDAAKSVFSNEMAKNPFRFNTAELTSINPIAGIKRSSGFDESLTFDSTDRLARYLFDKAGTSEFPYQGVLLRNIHDGAVDNMPANEIIYNIVPGANRISPKLVTPFSTFKFDLTNGKPLRYGGTLLRRYRNLANKYDGESEDTGKMDRIPSWRVRGTDYSMWKPSEITDIQNYAIQNPNWFWGDEGADVRQRMYNAGLNDIVKTIYDETPDDIRTAIPDSMLSENIRAERNERGVRDAINTKGVATALGAAAIPGAVIASAEIPLAYKFASPAKLMGIGKNLMGLATGLGIDNAVRTHTPYSGFGDMAVKTLGLDEVMDYALVPPEWQGAITESGNMLLNPGYYSGELWGAGARGIARGINDIGRSVRYARNISNTLNDAMENVTRAEGAMKKAGNFATLPDYVDASSANGHLFRGPRHTYEKAMTGVARGGRKTSVEPVVFDSPAYGKTAGNITTTSIESSTNYDLARKTSGLRGTVSGEVKSPSIISAKGPMADEEASSVLFEPKSMTEVDFRIPLGRKNDASLTDAIAKDRERIQGIIGDNGVVVGSLDTIGAGIHAGVPADTEVVTIKELEPELDKLLSFNPVQPLGKVEGYKGTSKLVHAGIPKNNLGIAHGVDKVLISTDADGFAVGKEAHEIYSSIYPDEYRSFVERMIKADPTKRGINVEDLKLPKPDGTGYMTDRELYDAFRASDARLRKSRIDFMGSYRDKHRMRAVDRIFDQNIKWQEYADDMSAMMSKYMKGYKTVGQQFPDMDFSDKASNLEFLKSIGVGDEAIAGDENTMRKLVEQYWHDNTFGSRTVDPFGKAGEASYTDWEGLQNAINTNYAPYGGTAAGGGGNQVGNSYLVSYRGSGAVSGAHHSSMQHPLSVSGEVERNIKKPGDLVRAMQRLQTDRVLTDDERKAILSIFSKAGYPYYGSYKTIGDVLGALGGVNKPEVTAKVAEVLDVPFIRSKAFEGSYIGKLTPSDVRPAQGVSYSNPEVGGLFRYGKYNAPNTARLSDVGDSGRSVVFAETEPTTLSDVQKQLVYALDDPFATTQEKVNALLRYNSSYPHDSGAYYTSDNGYFISDAERELFRKNYHDAILKYDDVKQSAKKVRSRLDALELAGLTAAAGVPVVGLGVAGINNAIENSRERKQIESEMDDIFNGSDAFNSIISESGDKSTAEKQYDIAKARFDFFRDEFNSVLRDFGQNSPESQEYFRYFVVAQNKLDDAEKALKKSKTRKYKK